MGGVPRAQWSHVVTLYEDGAKARAFIGDGDGDGDRAQVVVLDSSGTVAFHDADGLRESSARRLAAMADER